MRQQIILLLIGLLHTTAVQAQHYHQQLLDAYCTQNISLWENTLQAMQQQYGTQNPDVLVAHYGLIAFYLNQKQDNKAEQSLDELEKTLEQTLKTDTKQALPWAIRGALVGFRIGLSPYKAPILGPRSMAYLSKAGAHDSKNPYYLAETGNSLFYRPALFGGSKTEAIVYYSQAVAQFEKQANNKANWYYLNILNTLGQAYEKTGQAAQALECYQKALAYAPNFDWLKKHLPKFRKQHNF